MKRFLKLMLVVFALAALAACSGGKSKDGITVKISAEKGGVIETEEGASITIPAGAIAEDTEITMKIYTSEEFSENGDSTEYVTGIVTLEPADLNVSKPVVISIPVAKAVEELVAAAYSSLGTKVWQYSQEGLAVSTSKDEQGQLVVSTNHGDSVTVSDDGSLVVNIDGNEVVLSGKRDPLSVTEDAEPIMQTETNNKINMAAGHFGTFTFVAVNNDTNIPGDSGTDTGDNEPVLDGDSEPVSDGDSEPVSDGDTDDIDETDEDAVVPVEQTEAEKCEAAGGTWNETEENCTKTTSCGDLPENAEWNGGSSYTQTYADNAWSAEIAVEYSETAGECRYKCAEGYGWTGLECEVLPQPSLGLICTGQTKCYNDTEVITCPATSAEDYFGQDSQYLDKCTPQSFTLQTVAEENVVVDNNLGLMWQQSPSTETFNWDDAISHCDNLEYAGYSDWRLPNPSEFLTIVDIDKKGPAVDTDNFSGMPTTTASFWTNKENGIMNSYDSATVFNTYYGDIASSKNKTNTYQTLCVRGEGLPKPQFETLTAGGVEVVKDLTTGLMWQGTVPEENFTWMAALKHCEDLTYAGYADWRLPDKNELASLIDYDKTSKPYSYFPGEIFSNSFWSSSTHSAKNAWSVIYTSGDVYSEFKTYSFKVICVR